jgi:CubicO group peptidase (beta-lactamase class C family)
MIRFLLAVVSAALFSSIQATAQQPLSTAEASSVESFITTQMQRQRIPGLSMAIVRSNNVIYSKAFGIANLELNAPTTTSSVFKIGSTSKPFIATAIMMLVEEGKLSLDNDIAKYFNKTPSSWSGILLRHLISHTSGFPRELPGWTSYGDFSEEEFVAMIEKTEPTTKPGERYAYSNAGYFTLAAILTKVSGKPWPDFLKARIFDPLGMKSTRTTTWRGLVPNRASGYLLQDGQWVNEGFIYTVRPSGALMSTAEDLARWDIALRGGKVLKAQTLNTMFAPTRLSSGAFSAYGLGWEISEFRGRRLIAANGDILGFQAAFIHDIDDDVTIIVLINCACGNDDTIAKGALVKLLPELAVGNWKAAVDSQPDLGKALRQGLENIAASKPFGEIAVPALEDAFKVIPEAGRKALRERLANISISEFLREDKVKASLDKSGEPVDRIRYYRFTSAASVLHYATYWSASGKLLLLEALLE